jgi:hypothetical protein
MCGKRDGGFAAAFRGDHHSEHHASGYVISPKKENAFPVCIRGGNFAILSAVDALIVFLQLCGFFQVGMLEP